MTCDQKYIYIVLTHPQSVVSSIIHIVTKEPYTHSSLAFSPELSPMFSFARKFSRFPFWGGYKKETLIDGFYQHCSHLPGRIIALPVTDEQYERVHDKVETFWKNRGKLKYNISGLFLNAVGIAYARPAHYTCSQFISETLSEAGICEFGSPCSLVRPVHLTKLSGEIIFDGDLKEYTPDSMFIPHDAI